MALTALRDCGAPLTLIFGWNKWGVESRNSASFLHSPLHRHQTLSWRSWSARSRLSSPIDLIFLMAGASYVSLTCRAVEGQIRPERYTFLLIWKVDSRPSFSVTCPASTEDLQAFKTHQNEWLLFWRRCQFSLIETRWRTLDLTPPKACRAKFSPNLANQSLAGCHGLRSQNRRRNMCLE